MFFGGDDGSEVVFCRTNGEAGDRIADFFQVEHVSVAVSSVT